MQRFNSLRSALAPTLVVLCILSQPPQFKSQDVADTIRVTTQLVQTDVLVLDKGGEFVDGLKPEQFELRINGKARGISAFDRITAGTASEEEKIAAARGTATGIGVSPRADRGRTILFYLDDYHLSNNSITRTREMLKNFVDRQMALDDQVALITATGQLGFLEQFANEPAVLYRAIDKFAHRSFSTTDAERTPMTESEAAAITSEDRRVLDYFVDQLLKDMGRRPRGPSGQMKSRLDAEGMVRARARSMIDQSRSLSAATLSGLEKLVRSTSTMPWRKTLFLVSDGFMVHDQSNLDLRRISSTAAQAVTVIYSIDARGLSTGTPEASRKVAFDLGRTAGTNSNAITASQQPLQSLALDTAGTSILNTNAPAEDMDRALKETSNYYLLSWRPEQKELNNGFQAMEVAVTGRPDLTVRVRHGFSMPTPTTPAKKPSSKKKNEEPEKPLPAALRALVARRDLPVSLSVGYTDVGEKSLLITTTVEVPLEALNLMSAPQRESNELDLVGAIIDERGRSIAEFDENLTVKTGEMKAMQSRRVLYNHQLKLPPGLHQIRIAVQEKASSRIGSAMQWIEVPDLTAGKFSLSSLFIGEIDKSALETGKLSVNASHRFRSGSILGFFINIYNAKSSTTSDLVLQVQVFRDQQPVITKPLVRIDTAPAPDPARISYGEDLSLNSLPAGKYLLAITVIDRLSKNSAQQQTRFVVY